MNRLDLDYQNLLKDIIENGTIKKDRTGTGTKSVFGRVIRHNMRDGFPLLTTKKMFTKGIITELLWFLRGETNIQSLVKEGNNIWVGDCYKKYNTQLLKLESENNHEEMNKWMRDNGDNTLSMYSKEGFIEKIKTDDEFAKKWGDLGPCYGSQWRNWSGRLTNGFVEFESNGYDKNIKGIDQIANIIHQLKTNPDSRRIMVNAWKVDEIDQMTLPPCHYGFQVWTRELSQSERLAWYRKPMDSIIGTNHDRIEMEMDQKNVPTREISLSWNQRSVDTFLGLPFNIASYGFLLEMIAKEVNMVPGELIGYLGDTHLYMNHLDQAKEQIGRDYTQEERYNEWFRLNYETGMEKNFSPDSLPDYDNEYYTPTPKRTREPFPLPKFDFSEEVNVPWDFDNQEYMNFQITNYQHHEKISAPLSN